MTDTPNVTVAEAARGEGTRTLEIPLAAEILCYAGGALAVGAIAALLIVFWDQLGAAGQVSLCLLPGIAGIVGGWLIGRMEGKAAHRLSQFLLAVGVVGFAAAAGIGVFHLTRAWPAWVETSAGGTSTTPASEQPWGQAAAATVFTLLGGVLWWLRRGALLLLVWGLALIVGTMFWIQLAFHSVSPPDWAPLVALSVIAVACGALALAGRLEPSNAGLAVACVAWLAAMFALQALGRDSSWTAWVAAGVSIALVAAGVVLRRLVVLVFGALGTVAFTVAALALSFKGAIGASVALIIASAVVLLMAVAVALVAPRMRKPRGPASGETAGSPPAPVTPGEATEAPPTAASTPVRIPVAAEALGYVGGALAAASVFAVLTEFWSSLPAWLHVALPAVVAAVAFAAAWAIGRIGEKAAGRLSEFLLFIGIGAVGVTGGIATYEALSDWFVAAVRGVRWLQALDWALFVGSLAAAVAGGILWWRKHTLARHLAFGLAVAASSVTVLGIPHTTGPAWIPGIVLAAVGCIWLALSMLDWTPPRVVGVTLGTLGILGGIELAAVGYQLNTDHMVAWALWLGLGASVAFVVAGVPLRQMVFLGLGVAGIVVYVPELLSAAFGRVIGVPVILLAAGVLLLAAGVTMALVLPRMRAHPSSRVL